MKFYETLIILAALTTPAFAFADNACRESTSVRTCAIGAATSLKADLILQRGYVSVISTSFVQEPTSDTKCDRVGTNKLRAELRIDGDEKIQVIGLAHSGSLDGDVVFDPNMSEFKIRSFKTSPDSGVEFNVAGPISIPANHRSKFYYALVVDGIQIDVPVICN
jgi:hypothetical protein